MKLLHYILRNLSLPLLIILGVWAVTFYLLILYEINDETNDSLRNYKSIIIKEILADSSKLQSRYDIMNRYHIREIPASEANLSKDVIFDSVTYIEIEDEYEPVRVLRTCFLAGNGKYYELTIEMSTVEKEDLIETVLWSIVALYVTLLCCFLIVTRHVLKKSFRPLYNLLEWLKKYHPGRKTYPLGNKTIIEEFTVLNQAVKEATERNTEMYNQQKQFVENASHELQTPLAVCINKLELLCENPDCTEEQLKEMADLHRTLSQITKMNKSLLLLSRIENKQFPEVKPISINKLINELIQNISEIYAFKNIFLEIEDDRDLIVEMNESLAATLLSNLIKNAYSHNIPNGEISIYITSNSLLIRNTGSKEKLDKVHLFERFHKQSSQPGSTGLGLAIVKTICLIYNFRINYSYDGMHGFLLAFS